MCVCVWEGGLGACGRVFCCCHVHKHVHQQDYQQSAALMFLPVEQPQAGSQEGESSLTPLCAGTRLCFRLDKAASS